MLTKKGDSYTVECSMTCRFGTVKRFKGIRRDTYDLPDSYMDEVRARLHKFTLNEAGIFKEVHGKFIEIGSMEINFDN